VQKNNDATGQLLAFENRYTGPDASRPSPTAVKSERDIHDSLVYQHFEHFETSTQNTFDGFCRRWIHFCNKREYNMLDTSWSRGESFLQAERERHQNPGENIKIALTQFQKLCQTRGCPGFSKGEIACLHAVVNKARDDRATNARSNPVDKNRKVRDRNVITSQELEQVLRICADDGDRLKAARAMALILVNDLTG